ncbi:uncharacterized protein LOC120330032 [Styela clava]
MNKQFLIAFLCSTSLTVLLDIIALATTGWVTITDVTYQTSYGIYKFCRHKINKVNYNRYELYESLCQTFIPTTAGNVAATMLILAIFILIAAVALAMMTYAEKGNCDRIAAALCLVAWVLVLIGAGVYVGMVTSQIVHDRRLSGFSFGYAFGLIGVMNTLNIVSAVIGFKGATPTSN